MLSYTSLEKVHLREQEKGGNSVGSYKYRPNNYIKKRSYFERSYFENEPREGLTEAASEGETILTTHFCSLSNISY